MMCYTRDVQDTDMIEAINLLNQSRGQTAWHDVGILDRCADIYHAGRFVV